MRRREDTIAIAATTAIAATAVTATVTAITTTSTTTTSAVVVCLVLLVVYMGSLLELQGACLLLCCCEALHAATGDTCVCLCLIGSVPICCCAVIVLIPAAGVSHVGLGRLPCRAKEYSPATDARPCRLPLCAQCAQSRVGSTPQPPLGQPLLDQPHARIPSPRSACGPGEGMVSLQTRPRSTPQPHAPLPTPLGQPLLAPLKCSSPSGSMAAS